MEAVEDFAKLGYHILCEKPMATSVADCVKIRNLAQATSPNIFGMGHGWYSQFRTFPFSVNVCFSEFCSYMLT